MKGLIKYIALLPLFLVVNCDSRTYEEISGVTVIPEAVSYTKDVKPIIDNNCVMCHAPGGVSGFYPLTDYNLVKNAIDNILDRVQRPNGDPGKMPQGGSLSPAHIEILKKWKANGQLQ